MTQPEQQLSLVDHLDELRRRVIACVIATFLCMILAYWLYNPWGLYLLRAPLDALADRHDNPFVWSHPLLNFLRSSLEESQRSNLNLHFVGLLEAFLVKIRTSLLGGALLASPFIIYQIWKFLSVGLTPRERKAVRIFLPAFIGLFLLGLLFAYFLMLPVMIYFLVAGGGAGLIPHLTLSQYVSPVILCCFAFGLIFEMPLIILFLARLGLVSPTFLREKRRYAIVLMFVLGAILTPPDVVTQIMLALPMILLYELGVWTVHLTWKKKQPTS